MIEALLSVAASAATIATALLAFFTIAAWKKQYKYQRKADVVGEALVLAYQAIDVVRAIRSPIGRSTEGSSRTQLPNETPQETQALNDAFTPIERLQSCSELFAKMLVHRYKMMAEFGPDQRDIFEPVLNFKTKLLVRSRRAMDYVRGQRSRDNSEKALERRLKFQGDFEKLRWEDDENDDVNQRMQAMVTQLENMRQLLR